MVTLISGVVKLPPVPKEVPPVRTLNQFNVPTPDASNKTGPGPHREPFIAFGAVGIGFIVAVISVLGLTQPVAEVLDT